MGLPSSWHAGGFHGSGVDRLWTRGALENPKLSQVLPDRAGDQGGFCPCLNRSRRSRCPGNLDMPTFNGLRRTGYVRSGPLVPRDFPPEDEYGMGCLGKIRARCDVGTAARKSKSSSEPDTKWTTPPSGVANQAPSRLSAYLGPGVVPGRLNASVRMECLLTQYSQLDRDWR